LLPPGVFPEVLLYGLPCIGWGVKPLPLEEMLTPPALGKSVGGWGGKAMKESKVMKGSSEIEPPAVSAHWSRPGAIKFVDS